MDCGVPQGKAFIHSCNLSHVLPTKAFSGRIVLSRLCTSYGFTPQRLRPPSLNGMRKEVLQIRIAEPLSIILVRSSTFNKSFKQIHCTDLLSSYIMRIGVLSNLTTPNLLLFCSISFFALIVFTFIFCNSSASGHLSDRMVSTLIFAHLVIILQLEGV